MATSSAREQVCSPHDRIVADGPLRCTLYRRGVRIRGFRYDGPIGGGPRGFIGEFRDAPRRKFAFDLDNAPEDWGAMSLLSFREQHPTPKACLERFVRRVKIEIGPVDYAWYMETQPREESGGDPTTHFHWYWTKPYIQHRLNDGTNTVTTLGRGSKARVVLRGALDGFVGRAWLAAVGDTSAEFASFQAGGRTEPIRDSSAASFYPAAEASKKAQKMLPPGIEGLGRWCYISPGQRPVPIGCADMREYPLEVPMGYVYDRSTLGEVTWYESGTDTPIPPSKVPRPRRKGGE